MAAAYEKRFKELTKLSIEGQLEFFLKRYIFALGENWKETANLATKFASYTDARSGDGDLNVTEAADFLQKNGKTRTAKERSEELRDIDLDNNGRICFIEYLLLHYKVLVLKDFFESKGKKVPADIDLSKDGVGVTGVGEYILEAIFSFNDVDPKVEAAIEDVMKQRAEREGTMSGLKTTVADTSKTQVQRMKAQHELLRMEREDTTGADVALITLMAARRRVKRLGNGEKNEKALKAEKEAQDAEKKQQEKQSKDKLGAMMKSFQDKAKVDDTKFAGNAKDRASIKMLQSRGLNLYTDRGAEKNV